MIKPTSVYVYLLVILVCNHSSNAAQCRSACKCVDEKIAELKGNLGKKLFCSNVRNAYNRYTFSSYRWDCYKKVKDTMVNGNNNHKRYMDYTIAMEKNVSFSSFEKTKVKGFLVCLCILFWYLSRHSLQQLEGKILICVRNRDHVALF